MAGLVDTHCHLDAAEFDADRERVYSSAGKAGVSAIVVPAVERANFGAVTSICREYSGCFPAYGIHPLFVKNARPEDLDVLAEILQREAAVAVGEIGLDRHLGESERDDERQMFYFTAQLKIARELGKPVLLHVRRAIDAVLQQLRKMSLTGGIAHAFNGSAQQADSFIGMGFKLGFGGAFTHPRATRLRELATTLPLESIVLETDAPDIPPAWLHTDAGHARNEPAELARIAADLAVLRGVTTDQMIEATRANALAVLPGLASGMVSTGVCNGSTTSRA